MNRLIGITLLLISFSSFIYGRGNTRVANLRCDNSENPVAVESRHPVLRWQLVSGERGKKQSAYRVIVSGSLKQLDKGKGDYWDSGKVSSSESMVSYGGKSLPSRTQLYWKVMVWDEDNTSTGWSDVSHWSMGLLKPSDWKAEWIGSEDLYPDSARTFPAPYFRKEFVIKKGIKKAVVYVCGLGFYEMYFNGSRIGDQVLAPAVTNYDKRSLKKLLYPYDDQSTQRVLYNVFDVTSHLKKQKNVIGMVLGNGWYNQRDRVVEGHMWYDVPKMILQLEIEYTDGSRETVVSDTTWKTATGPILHDAIFTGEVYDARRELGSWNREAYDAAAWQSALAVRPPTGALQAQTIPFTKVMGTVDTSFEQVNDSVYLFSLPETVSGWCRLSVKGRAGDTVKLRFISDEGLDYGQEDTYILKGGGREEKWEPKFTWHAFKKIEVVAAGGVGISKQSIRVKSIYTDVRETGNFECSNELFNNIFQAYKRTMRANFKGIISSDPHRERLAYTGDGQVITESLLYGYDMTHLLRKFVADMSDASNKKTGYVPHTAPFGGGGGGPAWGSAYVLIPWNYFCHYGDTALLREHYQGMKHWVEYLRTRTDDKGIVVREEPGGWCLGEWSTPHNRIEIPASLVNTAYFYHVTGILADVANILEKYDDENNLRTRAQTIKKNFNAAFYNEATHHYWEGKQGADVFALAFGLVPEDKYGKVFAALLEHLKKVNYHFDTGILATPLLLKVLTQNGRVDLAYKLMDQRDFPSYGYLADKKNNTLWETWNGDGNDEGCGHCHPMFGSVVAWFYHSLAGIKPDQSHPGMKHFYIEPVIVADLKYCKATCHSLYGKISSDWRIDENGNLNLKIEVPANTSATVVMPEWGSGTVLEAGIPVSKVRHIVMDKVHPARLEVSSGGYNFVILK